MNEGLLHPHEKHPRQKLATMGVAGELQGETRLRSLGGATRLMGQKQPEGRIVRRAFGGLGRIALVPGSK